MEDELVAERPPFGAVGEERVELGLLLERLISPSISALIRSAVFLLNSHQCVMCFQCVFKLLSRSIKP